MEKKWVRHNNKLIQLSNVKRGTIGYYARLAGCIKVCVSYKNVYEEVIFQYNNIANTPQELIQVGDLVDDDVMGYLVEVLAINNNGGLLTNEYNDGQYIYSYQVVKIYTPNEDKSQYTLQWSKDE